MRVCSAFGRGKFSHATTPVPVIMRMNTDNNASLFFILVQIFDLITYVFGVDISCDEFRMIGFSSYPGVRTSPPTHLHFNTLKIDL